MLKKRLPVIAFVLLLAFTQKLGMQLWLHQWLHTKVHDFSSKENTGNQLQLKCYCLDDTLMPAEPSASINIIVPATSYSLILSSPQRVLYVGEKQFASLRGPPFLA
jgi:hypothetical protein